MTLLQVRRQLGPGLEGLRKEPGCGAVELLVLLAELREFDLFGGVGGRGMPVLAVELKDEISRGGRKGPTRDPSGQTARFDRLREKSERSIVAKKVVTRLERRDRA